MELADLLFTLVVSSVSVIVVLAFLSLSSFKNTVTKQRKLWKAYKNVKGPHQHWFWGNLDIATADEKGLLLAVDRIAQYPKVQSLRLGPYFRFISCYFPSVMQAILATDQPKVPIIRKFLYPWIGDGLLLSHGKKWKRNRKLLTPAFHFEILKNYIKILNESASTMVNKFRNCNDLIEVFEPVSLMTLDSILQCMMSLETDSQRIGKAHPYVKAVGDLSELALKRVLCTPWCNNDFIYSLTANGRKHTAAVAITDQQTNLVIRNRRAELKTNKSLASNRKCDFLDILLLAKDDKGNGLTETEIRHEVDTFLFEGHDTTASAISWIIYNLATYQDHQRKCREEVREVLKNRDYIEHADLARFTYLTMCIKESMRIHPPVPLISRNVNNSIFLKGNLNNNENTNIDGSIDQHEFPKHTLLELNLFLLHRNQFLWKNPETFNPNRFTPENIAKRSAFTYLPFSAGPRNCIGQNFAMMEIKIALAKCLMNFKFSVDERCERPSMLPYLVLKSKTGIQVIVNAL